MYVKSYDHSDHDTNGNPKAKYDCAVLTNVMAGREPDAKTDKLFTLTFLLANEKNAKMLGQTLGP